MKRYLQYFSRMHLVIKCKFKGFYTFCVKWVSWRQHFHPTQGSNNSQLQFIKSASSSYHVSWQNLKQSISQVQSSVRFSGSSGLQSYMASVLKHSQPTVTGWVLWGSLPSIWTGPALISVCQSPLPAESGRNSLTRCHYKTFLWYQMPKEWLSRYIIQQSCHHCGATWLRATGADYLSYCWILNWLSDTF